VNRSEPPRVRPLGTGARAGFPVETARFVQRLARCVKEGGAIPPMEFTPGTASWRTESRTKDA